MLSFLQLCQALPCPHRKEFQETNREALEILKEEAKRKVRIHISGGDAGHPTPEQGHSHVLLQSWFYRVFSCNVLKWGFLSRYESVALLLSKSFGGLRSCPCCSFLSLLKFDLSRLPGSQHWCQLDSSQALFLCPQSGSDHNALGLMAE